MQDWWDVMTQIC